MRVKYAVGLLLLSVVMFACGSVDFYEQSKRFPKHEWEASEKPAFSFTIADTTVSYHIYVVLRHTDAYRYNNIWLNIATQAPADTVRNQLVDVALADNAKGWLGTGMDDIFDHRARITRAPVKLKAGTYTFTLSQAMREDPLAYVLSAGIRVEKVRL